MRSRRHRPGKILTFIIMLSFILLLSLLFGHVLGSFYLENITNEDYELTESKINKPDHKTGVNAKTKVLRLNKIPYYTIQAGVFTKKESALSLGNILAEKGLPAIIMEDDSYYVMVGFLNNWDKLSVLADSITIDGQKPIVLKKEINKISFKFITGDTFAETDIAPFLGDISTSLHKGLLLYTDINFEEKTFSEVVSKFVILADELGSLALTGNELADKSKELGYSEGLMILAKRCGNWAESLKKIKSSDQGLQVLISQQQALALLEDYHRFIAITN